jgi:hypothetical protein
MCSEYAKIENVENITGVSFKSLSEDNLMGEWERLKLLKKVLEDRIEDIKFYVLEELRSSGAKSVIGTDKKMSVTQMPRTEYSIEALAKALSLEDLVKVVNVSNSKVDKFLKMNSEYRTELQGFTTKKFNSPTLKITKK